MAWPLEVQIAADKLANRWAQGGKFKAEGLGGIPLHAG